MSYTVTKMVYTLSFCMMPCFTACIITELSETDDWGPGNEAMELYTVVGVGCSQKPLHWCTKAHQVTIVVVVSPSVTAPLSTPVTPPHCGCVHVMSITHLVM